MPRLIKDGAIVDDHWLPPAPDATAIESGQICTLAQWKSLADKRGSGVQIEPDEEPGELFADLTEIELIVIDFPVFTDGRGFSHGRSVRERGFRGELRATGHFIRDQLTYLRRVGFNAFQLPDETKLEAALDSLTDFSESYQATYDQPLPLFRRRQTKA